MSSRIDSFWLFRMGRAQPGKSGEEIVQTLKDSELRYRRLFEAAQDGILILNAETGMIEDVNPYLINMLGYSREEFVEKKLWEVGAFLKSTQSWRASMAMILSRICSKASTILPHRFMTAPPSVTNSRTCWPNRMRFSIFKHQTSVKTGA